ncbi:lysozyme inhibitor LprI family protein [Flavobacterium piscisymbiosum]|uniref:lysozyme inhibitor LprI family protein n=1 Tax=Flavobacterium piscisymbiosum TaxID=2893753 RepID=UPI003204BB30
MEIEKRLRTLADKYSIESNRFSVTRLIEALAKEDIITNAEKISLIDIISTLNKASHGIEYDQRNANWVIENGPKILESLDEKLELRGGRLSAGNSEEKIHWIEKSFDNCEWTTNAEWGECITKHTDLWEKELNRIYQSLLIKLIAPQKTKLVETQINWAKQIDLEKDFLYSFEDLQIKIGREGIFITAMNFMNKRTNIRIRRSSN